MILAALLFAAAGADAYSEPDCTRDDLPQQDMNFCAAQDYRAADAELNAQWKLTVAHMKEMDESFDPSPGDKRPGYYKTLLDAQRGWIAYRDGHCASEGYIFRGGTMEPLIHGSCMAALTRARTAELKQLETGED